MHITSRQRHSDRTDTVLKIWFAVLAMPVVTKPSILGAPWEGDWLSKYGHDFRTNVEFVQNRNQVYIFQIFHQILGFELRSDSSRSHWEADPSVFISDVIRLRACLLAGWLEGVSIRPGGGGVGRVGLGGVSMTQEGVGGGRGWGGSSRHDPKAITVD